MKIRIFHNRLAGLILTFAALGLSLGWVSNARAQSTTDGAIGGTVYDASGAVVPGATVVVHNDGTDATQTQTTDPSGFYRVGKLVPAVYTVTITAKGFETFMAKQVVVTVGSLTNVTPHLTVGATTQTVSVSGVAPQINTTSNDFTDTLNQTAISNLPIQRARWSAFSQLTPGVVQDSNGYGLLSFRGVSTLLNNVTIDGADDNQAFFSEQRGRTRISYSDSQESVQEFQVNTSNYSAEYGRAAGGVVNTVTKSGTNQFHGDVNYRNRENGWAARNPFTAITEPNSSGGYTSYPTKPTDYWDIEAGSIGGPIKKDKVFFFFSYDNFYRNFPGDAVPSNPSAFFATPVSPAALSGAGGTCTAPNNQSIGALSSNITTSSSIFGGNSNLYTATKGACAIAGIVVQAPQGNANPVSYATGYNDYLTGLSSFISNNLGTAPRIAKQGIFFPKIDWQINEKNRASFEVNRMRWISPYGVQTQVTDNYSVGSAFGNDNVSDTWGVGKLDTFLTPALSNEFRYQIGRDFEWESAPPPDPYEVNEMYKTTAGSSTYPSWVNYTNPFGVSTYASLTGGLALGTAYYDLRYDYPNELRNQAADTMTWSHGNHTIKFGTDFNHISDLISNIYQQNGSFSYSGGISAFLEDIYAPAACSGHPCQSEYSSFGQGFGTLAFTIPTDDIAFFGQDDWKVMPHLSLSLGLRWDYEHMPAPFYPNPAVPATETLPNYKKNFGPRAGFAWDVFGNGKTAVRGGFGLYYGRIMNSQIFSVVTQSGLIQNGVVTGQPSVSFTSAAKGGPYFPEVFSAEPTSSATPATMYFNPHYHSPYAEEADLSIERNVGWNTIIHLGYMASFGHMLPQTTDDNIALGTNAAGAGSTLTYAVGAGGPLTGTTYTTPFYAYRPNPNFTQMLDLFGVSSNYNALVVQATHRLSHSIQFDANYTWSHTLDYDSATVASTTITATSGFGMLEPNNMQLEYGDSNLDVPQRFVLSMVANSPWHVNGPLHWIADGWEFAPIFATQDGLPYSATVSGTAPGTLGSGGGVNGSDGTFRLPIRNNYRESPSQDLDVRIGKTIPIKERIKLEIFAEAYNLFNHYNVQTETTEAYSVSTSGTVVDSTGASHTCASATPCLSAYQPFQSVSAANNTYEFWTRQLQFGAKLSF